MACRERRWEGQSGVLAQEVISSFAIAAEGVERSPLARCSGSPSWPRQAIDPAASYSADLGRGRSFGSIFRNGQESRTSKSMSAAHTSTLAIDLDRESLSVRGPPPIRSPAGMVRERQPANSTTARRPPQPPVAHDGWSQSRGLARGLATVLPKAGKPEWAACKRSAGPRHALICLPSSGSRDGRGPRILRCHHPFAKPDSDPKPKGVTDGFSW